MLIDCDALSPKRWGSRLWLKLWQHFMLPDLTRDEAFQLAVLLNTRGFTRAHHHALFGWNPSLMNPRLDALVSYFADNPAVHEAAEDNTCSINQQDGLTWLKATLELDSSYRGSVPLWTSLALCGLYDDGLTDPQIADQLGLRQQMGIGTEHCATLISRWRQSLIFEPLTGLQLT